MFTSWIAGPANPQTVLWIMPVFWWLRFAKLLQLAGALTAVYGVLGEQSKLRIAAKLQAAAAEAPRLKAPREMPVSTAFWWGAAALVATVAIMAATYRDLSAPALGIYSFLGLMFGLIIGFGRWLVGNAIWTARLAAFHVRRFGVPAAAKLFSAEMGDRSAIAIGLLLVVIGMVLDIALS
jgi:hypothetical protein